MVNDDEHPDPSRTPAAATGGGDMMQNQMLLLMQQQMEQMRINQEGMLRMSAENMELKHKLQEARTANAPPQTRKPDRPMVDTEMTDNDWSLFLDSWQRYKVMSRLSEPHDIRNELRATCAAAVNKMLFELIGPQDLNSANETQLLGHIKRVAVQGVHTEVHRQRFFRITQAAGESLNQFVAKLKAQATLCQFQVACNNDACARSVSYTEEMVAHQMISGLGNADHQAKILAEAGTLTSSRTSLTG